MHSLRKSLATVVQAHFPDYTGPIEILPNASLEYGDFGSAVAFTIAKQLGSDPRVAAETIVAQLQPLLGESVTVMIAPNAPFINFTLTPQAFLMFGLSQEAHATLHQIATDHTVNLEFISANPTGPLTLANGRGGYSGDALARVLAYAGAHVEREYYYNDSGNQIKELGLSVIASREGREITEGYKGAYIDELGQKIAARDPYQAGKEASDYIFTHWIKPMIARMRITFDTYKSEQSLIDDGTLLEAVTVLRKHKLLYEADGALWLKTTQYGDEKDRVLQRSDEEKTYTYLMKDIAYHWDKLKRGYTDVVTMVGADHFTEAKTLDLIVRQILAPAAGWTGIFRQPIIQFVRLIDNGQEIKMSKRAGNFVTIDDLLDRVNSDVARFFFLMRDLSSHMDFDLTLAQETSDKNPVYYVQYAFVRAKHILDQAPNESSSSVTNYALSSEERRLLIHLTRFELLIADITETYAIHKLPHYAIELAKLFHSFYAKHPVLKADDQARPLRLAITKHTFHTLETALSLMGISQPERMVQ